MVLLLFYIILINVTVKCASEPYINFVLKWSIDDDSTSHENSSPQQEQEYYNKVNRTGKYPKEKCNLKKVYLQ